MAEKVQIPAKNPAIIPHEISVFISVLSARNIPRLTDINKEKTAVNPKIFPLLPERICSSVNPDSRIQIFPNKPGEYQIPPTTKADNPATKTASQLILLISILLLLITKLLAKFTWTK